ncbi:MAG: hypothetical protein PVJ04_09120 [Gemmatimonadota bacterium]|jgi:hypothetical protein
MTPVVPHLNLILAWGWIVLGTVLGLTLGSFFHKEEFLDGYGSLKRRLYRLAHVALFGLGILNLLFFFTTRILPQPSPWLPVASWSFVVSALTMPTTCILVAHLPRARPLFAIPVLSALLGGLLTLREVWIS